MNNLINRERLATTFTTLCEISSPSKKEKPVADYLKVLFADLGADEIIEDGSRSVTGSDSGNLIIRFNGNGQGEGVFFSCHMDTVEPGNNVKVARTGDIFTSRGDTILGSDDKSGIAGIIELLTIIKEGNLSHCLIEVVLTTCEEIGLLGAKTIDHKQISAPYGYALDSSGIDTVITGAPAANKFKIRVHGAAAHAGLNPELGINAIQIAAGAIAGLRLGRIDEETTANIGLVEGGVATNIVPELATIRGEVRSHSQEKLDLHTRQIEEAFTQAVKDWQNPSGASDQRPTVEIDIEAEYPAMKLGTDTPVLQRLRRAEEKSGKELNFIVAGGGSDANIFNGYGIPTAIIATGMDKVHTTDEQIDLANLVKLTELLIGIVETA